MPARNGLSVADWVSLSRIPLALAFLMLFEGRPGVSLTFCIVAALVAQISDHLDGYLARRRGPPPETGWLLDSIPDRAFHLAALLAFAREFGLPDSLVWLFVLRELCVYAVWIAQGDFEELRPGFRTLGLIHAGLIRLAIAIGCAIPFGSAIAQHLGLEVVNVLVALSSLFGFYCLFLVLRADGGGKGDSPTAAR